MQYGNSALCDSMKIMKNNITMIDELASSRNRSSRQLTQTHNALNEIMYRSSPSPGKMELEMDSKRSKSNMRMSPGNQNKLDNAYKSYMTQKYSN